RGGGEGGGEGGGPPASPGKNAPPGFSDTQKAGLDQGEGTGEPRVPGNSGIDAPPEAQHSVRRGGLPEYGRLRKTAPRHGEDPRLGLRPRLRLLQRGNR